MEPGRIAILDFRLDHTQESVGDRIGVTRQRTQQLEQKARAQVTPVILSWAEPFKQRWATQLEAVAVSEKELFDALCDPAIDLEGQSRLARIALMATFPQAVHPATFREGVLTGWWTTDRLGLQRSLRSITRNCPLSETELDSLLERLNVPQTLPSRLVLQVPGSPVRYYSSVCAWVRSRASHRDAAVSVLHDAGRPLAPAVLASRLGQSVRALNANLARDHRVRQIRPTGLWTLVDWIAPEDDAAAFQSTVDAVVAVLGEQGPLRRKELVRRVIDVYPVSPWAIHNALESPRVGRTSSGAWDIAERGAQTAIKRPPRRPQMVTETGDGRLLAFVRTVDSELMRGSGSPISSYVGWRIGLKQPGDRRTFSSAIYPPISIRRSFGTCSVSTLRLHARALSAILGDELLITLELPASEYHVRLVKKRA